MLSGSAPIHYRTRFRWPEHVTTQIPVWRRAGESSSAGRGGSAPRRMPALLAVGYCRGCESGGQIRCAVGWLDTIVACGHDAFGQGWTLRDGAARRRQRAP